ncbi:MAG: hypothetical protein ACKVZJ_11845 [Phycisphaerales bacterium]
MTYAKRLTILAMTGALALCALQPSADARRRLTDEEVTQRTVDSLNTSFNRSRPRIINFGESAVARINLLQERNSRQTVIDRAATTARRSIERTHLAGNRSLESLAMKGVRDLTRRNAGTNLIEDVNAVKLNGLTGLQTVADECYTAINSALAD